MILKEITFTFENCDWVTIDGKYVGRFCVDDIHKSIYRVGFNTIEEMDSVDFFTIEIHKNGNIEHYPFGIKEDKEMAFERIVAYNDITSIRFELVADEDDDDPIKSKKFDYLITWTGDNEYENDAQKSYISDLGNLYLAISKDKTIDDLYDLQDINNANSMGVHFDLLNICKYKK